MSEHKPPELLPCPFCGKEAQSTNMFQGNEELVGCSNRKCILYYSQIRVSEWNTRVPASTLSAESPILAFQAWCERWCTDNGRKLTQTEYGIAYAAFIAAHPGEGPHSHIMETGSILSALREALEKIAAMPYLKPQAIARAALEGKE